MVFSAVFARFGWLNRFGTADRSVFCLRGYFSCSRVYPAAWPNSSARQPALMSVGLSYNVFVCRRFVCFVVPDVLRTAVALVCWSVGFLFRFWAADPTSRVVDGVLQVVVVFIRFSRRCAAIFAFSWLIAVFYFGCWPTFDCVFACFLSAFSVFRNICRFLLRLMRVVCFCNKC